MVKNDQDGSVCETIIPLILMGYGVIAHSTSRDDL